MGKDGTQLLRHCVRLLVRVSTDLLAVRLSGIDLSFCFLYAAFTLAYTHRIVYAEKEKKKKINLVITDSRF